MRDGSWRPSSIVANVSAARGSLSSGPMSSGHVYDKGHSRQGPSRHIVVWRRGMRPGFGLATQGM
jgi:hypothetical protein